MDWNFVVSEKRDHLRAVDCLRPVLGKRGFVHITTRLIVTEENYGNYQNKRRSGLE